MKIAKIGKILRDRKAVSPVISVLLMVSIAVVAALITYTWVTGFVGTTTVKAGHAIQIQAVNLNDTSNVVKVYVQNVGDGPVEITDKVFINGVAYTNQTTFGTKVLDEGEIAYFQIDYSTPGITGGEEYTIRVVCTDGTFTEGKFIAPME